MPPIIFACPRLDRTPEQFAALRAVFAGVTEQSVCRRLGIPTLAAINPATIRQNDSAPLAAPSDILIRLFVEGHPAPRATAEEFLGPASVSLLLDFGLLMADDGGETVAATVALYPVQHLLIASDRYNNADGTTYEGWNDLVYPALFSTTERFLKLIPRKVAGADVLDLCSGTGVAGLLLASAARTVVCADLTERSASFARFNASLNGLANVETATGDLYAAVTGRQFDCIVAHPPYQPVVDHRSLATAGGQDGEQISRRAIAEAYPYLKPGGRLYCLCQLTDRMQPVEVRVRSWIDDTASEDMDVAFICLRQQSFSHYAAVETLRNQRPYDSWKKWVDTWKELGASEMSYGMVVLQRREGPRQTFTVRRASPALTSDSLARILAAETFAAQPDFLDRVGSANPRAIPGATLEVKHTLGPGGGWTQDSLLLRREEPVQLRLPVDAATAGVLGAADGSKSSAALRAGIPFEVPDEYFERMLRLLFSNLFLELPGENG